MINIPKDLLDRLKTMAWERGFDLNMFIIELLKHDIENWEREFRFRKDI